MIFLDSSFLIALFVPNDQWHNDAVRVYNDIKNDKLVISKMVVAETITLLGSNLETKFIREIYKNINNLFLVLDDGNYFDKAMKNFIKYDGSISFFDSMYLYLMKKEGIYEIASFDSDFDGKNVKRVF